MNLSLFRNIKKLPLNTVTKNPNNCIDLQISLCRFHFWKCFFLNQSIKSLYFPKISLHECPKGASPNEPLVLGMLKVHSKHLLKREHAEHGTAIGKDSCF